MNDIKNNREHAVKYVLEIFNDMKAMWGAPHKTRDALRREKNIERASSEPFAQGRNPKLVAQVFKTLIKEQGWQSDLQAAQIIAQWEEIVGPQVSRETEILSFEKGVLTVLCKTYTYTNMLRTMRFSYVAKLQEEFPKAGLKDIKFQQKDAVSWKRGRYSVPGRGPRDTYD